MNKLNLGNVDMNPQTFYAVADMMNKVGDSRTVEDVVSLITSIGDAADSIYPVIEELSKANNALNNESFSVYAKRSHRMRDDADYDPYDGISHSASGQTFLKVSFDLLNGIFKGYNILTSIIQDLIPGHLFLSKKRFHEFETTEDIQRALYEFQLNKPVVDKFVNACMRVEQIREEIYSIADNSVKILDGYYKSLLKRHSTDGVEIYINPVVTDVAISIYENIDAHGEVQSGRSSKDVSMYTRKKAETIAKAIQNPVVREFISDPEKIIGTIQKSARDLHRIATRVDFSLKDTIDSVKSILGVSKVKNKSSRVDDQSIEDLISHLAFFNPMSIRFMEKNVILTAEERFNLQFKNGTLNTISKFVVDSDSDPASIVDFVLYRKEELRDYFQSENSFYVCKIGHGNPFSGEAPGALQVVPGQRPNINIGEILGSGFAEVKDFMSTIESASKWQDLFIATSPSKTADKSNVLLVGPQGCGKSELLRAVGGDKQSIGVFAQGSDFLTCWKGEAEKNPKRLFESCVKIQKESRKHVHILIDEIDSVLNRDKEFGATNLTLEFQILMDGVVHYPRLSVWGATNFPERIPMPMIRRFSKVLIVGELSQSDRVKLLKQFVNYMPTDMFSDKDWEDCAIQLDGAVGDVIRKVVDHVWRTKMNWFVSNFANEAQNVAETLNKSGVKFQIASFNSKDRENFKQDLGKYVRVTPDDLRNSILLHLENIAVHNEIQTAKETYAKAHAFINQLKSSRV